MVDSWILDHLERIIGIMLLSYPKHYVFYKHRFAQYDSLIRLFVALYLKGDALDKLLSKIGMEARIYVVISNQPFFTIL